METSKVTEESGPNEDHFLLRPPDTKVFDDHKEITRRSGVRSLERTDPSIETFLRQVPYLIGQNETVGLIWNKNLKPENFKYEKGVHFVSTREANRKTTHSTVSFYRDGATGAIFAIKKLEKDTYFNPEEVKIGLTIQHPNICSVYGIIIRNGLIHILLEHAGSPLYEERAWIAECPKRMQSFTRQSFEALQVIHKHGFVHCDVKPDNIMIEKHSNHSEFTVKLIDFGTCYAKDTSLPSTAHTTLWYWSPEIWQARDSKNEIKCTPAMDVYALALTLYFVHTSNHLMKRVEKDDLKNLMTESPGDILLIALPETIPSDLSAIMRSCLDENVNTRSTAQEALAAVDALTRRPHPTAGEENYKTSFDRMVSSLNETPRHARPNISSIVFRMPTTSEAATPNINETGGSLSSINRTEKKEFKTAAKVRKVSCLSVTKCNKSSQKSKKVTKHLKLNFPKVPTQSFQSPLVTPDCDFEKGTENKLDDRAYCCSTLLKNLALQIKEPKYVSSSSVTVGNKTTGKSTTAPGKAMETESITQLPVTQPVDKTYQHIQDNAKVITKNEQKAKVIAGSKEEGSLIDININPPKQVQFTSKTVHKMQEDGLKKDSGNNHDDMEFLLDAFDDNVFNGSDDEIVNHLYTMLDKDESAHSLQNEAGTSTKDPVIKNTDEEPMEADSGPSVRVSNISDDESHFLAVKGNRKRMAESTMNPSGIPGKTSFLPPVHQIMDASHLPYFDQFMPESS